MLRDTTCNSRGVICKMSFCKVLSFSFPSGNNLVAKIKNALKNISNDPKRPYRQLIRRLRYRVYATQPEIAHVVRYLNQYLDKFTHTHWNQAKYIVLYLKKTVDFGLVFDGNEDDEVFFEAYSDANHAEDPEDRQSVTGHVLLMCVLLSAMNVSRKTACPKH